MTYKKNGRPTRIGPRHPTVIYIHEHRKAKGLTQEQLADRLGVTKGAVSRWEAKPRKSKAHRRTPDINVLAAIAEALGIHSEELYHAPDTKPHEPGIDERLEKLPKAVRDEAIAYVDFIIRRHTDIA